MFGVCNAQGASMSALKTRVLAGICLIQFVASMHIGCTQKSTSPLPFNFAPRSLKKRIPEPDPKKYQSVQDAMDWKNPYLVVHPEGIEIVGMTPRGRFVPVESVPRILEKLPDSQWPYGLVVAVQDTGILSGKADVTRIEATGAKLLHLLEQLGITADRWPSA
jgi:hypothetical protein